MSRRWIFPAVFSVAVVSLAAGAARPANDSVVQLVSPGWRAGKLERLPVDAVTRWGGDPAVEKEYGVRFLEHQIFTQAQGSAEVVAEHAADTTSAYGLFTFYRQRDMTGVPGMHYAASDQEGAIFFRGQLFVRVVLPQPPAAPISPESLQALLAALGAKSPPTSEMDALPSPLPSKDLIEGSEKYLLGPVAAKRILPALPTDLLGFSLGAEIKTGEYSDGKSEATVAVVTYPTPQIAHSLFEQIQKRLNLNQAGSAFGKQAGSFVILVFNAATPSTASRLMEMFNRRVAVSWDKPYLGDKPPLYQMLEFIVQNLIMVFYLCGWSVVCGVMFYLSKRAARRWFPETSFGQPDEARIITLKLN